MALAHATSWRETYRGTLVSDEVLDAPTFLSDRAAFWTRALTDQRWAHMRVAVSEHDGRISGVAMSGPSETETQHLCVLYDLADAKHCLCFQPSEGLGRVKTQAAIRCGGRLTRLSRIDMVSGSA